MIDPTMTDDDIRDLIFEKTGYNAKSANIIPIQAKISRVNGVTVSDHPEMVLDPNKPRRRVYFYGSFIGGTGNATINITHPTESGENESTAIRVWLYGQKGNLLIEGVTTTTQNVFFVGKKISVNV